MKKQLLILGVLFSNLALAQVGINEDSPKATLDINKKTNGTSPEGLLIPRLTADELKAMTAIGEDQNSMLVYVTEPLSDTNNKTGWLEAVDGKGYYYFDYDLATPESSRWRRIKIGYGSGTDYLAGNGTFLEGNKFVRNGLQEINSSNNEVNQTTGSGEYGWRYVGVQSSHYGNIGKYATDLGYIPVSYDEKVPLQDIGISASVSFSNAYSKYGNPELASLATDNMGATGKYSFVAGVMNAGKADFSTTSGFGNLNEAGAGVALGAFNTVKGTYSVGIGSLNKLTPEREAYVIGGQNLVEAKLSVVLGTSNGNTNQGAPNKVSGLQTVTIGRLNGNTGDNSVAIGVLNENKGNLAVSLGYKLSAYSQGAVAVGVLNTEDVSPEASGTNNKKKRVFVVGNGTSSDKSDAFMVLRNGKTGIDIDNFETTTSDAKLQVAGTIKIGNNGDTNKDGVYQNNEMPCNKDNAGSIRYKEDGNVGKFEGCRKSGANSYSWEQLNNIK